MPLAFVIGHFNRKITFRQLETSTGISVHAHRAEMHQMGVQPEFGQSHKHIMRRRHIIIDGIAFFLRAAH